MILKIDELGISREITEGAVISVGRKGFGADIEIDNDSISRLHADIKLERGELKVFDRDSKNGVSVNGVKIAGSVWHTITTNDKVGIMFYTFKFTEPRPQPSPQPQPDPKPNPQPGPAAGAAANKSDLNGRFKELLRSKQPIKIGRLESNEITLPDALPDDKIVGRLHAEITYRDNNYYIEDLDSKNGTYVNDERIPPRQLRAISSTDTILIHLHYFNLEDGYRDLRNEVAIRAEGIGKTYKNGFVGLQPLTIDVEFKQVVALMGPSGCGKSTLLKTLNGDSPATSGDVFIHGLSLVKNYNLLKKKIGYVPQDDTIHKELTVARTLYLAAKLRLPDSTPETAIQQKVSEVLKDLNFDEDDGDIMNKVVGGLSGGQRKRICIAVELLSQPTILFLDEPTSPLDPETIEKFLISLRNLAKKGTTIVMVTHKPEDLKYADKIIFLAAKGYHVHSGDERTLLQKFNVDNIIKVYTYCGDTKKEPFDVKYYIKPKGKITTRTPVKEMAADKQNSLWRQFYWLTVRYSNIKLNDKDNLGLLIAQPVIIAGLVAIIFPEIAPQVLFMISVSAIWFGVSNSSKEIVGEFSVYKRERMFNLNIHTYILSKWLVLSLIALIQVLIFIGIVSLAFHNDKNLGNYFQNSGYMFLIASASTLFGLLLSAFFSTTEKVLTVVPIALMPQIMLAGIVTLFKKLPVVIISYFTFGRWGTEGFMRIQKTLELPREEAIPIPPAKPIMAPAYDHFYYSDKLKKTGEDVVTLFNSMQLNILAVVVLALVMYIGTYVSLKKKDTI